ncbi:3-ketoacyl-CoA thiolase 1, peroxisomal-like [Aristolochia californica]|uniref:3-ketoacyl-CoA thiolase 1, peroxisomal-like n=1 Tax=Aristolochia californica TaxID=171875 RepID=UPI0035D68CBD
MKQTTLLVFQPMLACGFAGCKHSMLVSSSLQVVTAFAAAIQAGFDDMVVGAGLDSITANPMAWEGSIHLKIKNFLQAPNFLPLGITSEYVPHRIDVTRQEQDHTAILYHKQATAAIASVATKIIDTTNQEEKNVVLPVDDGCRHNAFLSDRAKLKTVFKKDGMTMLVTQANKYIVVGVDPSIMGIGLPVAISAVVKAMYEEVVPTFDVMVLNCIGVCYNK